MSRASDRKAMADTLAAYSLVSTKVAARFLDCSAPQVRKLVKDGTLPGIQVGADIKLDPIDLAVHVLAGRERLGREAYWKKHGEATPEHARRYVARIRKLNEEAGRRGRSPSPRAASTPPPSSAAS